MSDRNFHSGGRNPNDAAVGRRDSDVPTSGLFDAIDAHCKLGGRIVFWTCPNGCRDIVEWNHAGPKSVATCRKCGASNCELTCGCPLCGWMQHDTERDGGWCRNDANRAPACPGFPAGFTPSVASTGGCDLHTSNKEPTR